MSLSVIVDTGPLVALLNKAESHHEWSRKEFTRLTAPPVTCEAVLSEACFLLKDDGIDPARVIEIVERGALRLDFSIGKEIGALAQLMRKYRDIGISLADACLVRMSELHARCEVMTLDRDFLVYRRNGRQHIPLIAPFQA